MKRTDDESAAGAETEPRPAARARRKGGETTRARILATALDLFRRDGFDRATMRDIARGAGVSLGAAYHYFPSKESIALAFYRDHLTRHAEAARLALRDATTLRSRMEAVFATALDVRGPDRPVLGALTRTVLDVSNPISLFAEETRDLREISIELFRECVALDEVAEDLREPLALGLWVLHLGLMLRFVLDDTPGQRATRNLMTGALDLAPSLVMMLGTPFLAPVRAQLIGVLESGGLLTISDRREPRDSD